MTTANTNMRIPTVKTLQEAAKLAIVEDRPVMMDYWMGSIQKTTMIGVNVTTDEKGVKTTEKLLVRNENEYTSPIANVFRVKTGVHDSNGIELQEYIVMTEHSIYIVDSQIPVRNISNE
jgi:hypothetical protein